MKPTLYSSIFLLSLLPITVVQAQHKDHSGMDHSRHMMASQAMPTSTLPSQAGQSAFGAIQEIVEILNQDPSTDWSQVNIAALREHLVDMNQLTLRAQAETENIKNGVEFTVTGFGRTRDAIQSMVPAHAAELDKINGWRATATTIPNGARLSVTSTNETQIARIRALGFFGLMATGAHHQAHHLAIAKGAMMH